MRRNKKVLKAAAWAMAFTMVVTGAEIPVSVTAARKPKLNRKKATLRVGKTIRLRVKNAGKKKVKWSSSKKKIATVNKKGIVKAQNPGKTVIKAKVGGKVLKCRVTVRNPIDSMPSADVSSAVPVTPLPTSRVAATGTPKTSAKVIRERPFLQPAAPMCSRPLPQALIRHPVQMCSRPLPQMLIRHPVQM